MSHRLRPKLENRDDKKPISQEKLFDILSKIYPKEIAINIFNNLTNKENEKC